MANVDLLDITATVPGSTAEVEIQSRPTGQVLYVHFQGQTVLRICRLSKVTVIGEKNADNSRV